MGIRKTVNEILEDAAFLRQPKAYKDVYFIKVLNPGDRKSIFVSFRYKIASDICLICRTEINLEYPEKNTSIAISILKIRERESFTFFRKRQAIVGRSIIEILQKTVAPLLIDKITKVKEMNNVNR
ncbi:hypothetical protein YUBABA_02100 [Serratia phage vB_SmaM-Yubaba]|nr:hypothetical protein SUREIYA_00250 [Serratia phage vB_SmaM-Sureiya]UQT03412.1 hypothetical protein YUBABA_02100 [Serratia phage vB_SmaM-Yubaba]